MRGWMGLVGGVLLALGGAAAEAAERIDLWVNADAPQLRGANLYQRRVYPELDGPEFLGPGPFGPPVEAGDLAGLAAAGANLVVLSHPGIFTEGAPYRLDGDALANLDRLVEMATAADLFVVIAFRTGPGRSEFAILPDGAGVWYDPGLLDTSVWGDAAAQDGWVAMWAAAAEHFRGHPAVIGYELMVEPNSNHIGADAENGALDIWDPAAFEAAHAGSLYDWNQLHPRILAAIRAVDPDTPVLIGGNGYSGGAWLPFVAVGADANTVYTFHEYQPFAYTHQEPGMAIAYPGRIDADWDGQDDPFDAALLERLLQPARLFASRTLRPVAVTEFGAVRWAPGVERFLSDRIARFEDNRLNWALWGWPVAWPPMAAGDNAFSLGFGPDPAATGPAATAPGFDALRQAWSLNAARPSNTPF